VAFLSSKPDATPKHASGIRPDRDDDLEEEFRQKKKAKIQVTAMKNKDVDGFRAPPAVAGRAEAPPLSDADKILALLENDESEVRTVKI
jgi:hypothetical protein